MSVLQDVEAPEDFVYEWKRYTLLGRRDQHYLDSLIDAGWAMVPQTRHPALGSTEPEIIVNDGLVLMGRHKHVHDEALAQQAKDALTVMPMQFTGVCESMRKWLDYLPGGDRMIPNEDGTLYMALRDPRPSTFQITVTRFVEGEDQCVRFEMPQGMSDSMLAAVVRESCDQLGRYPENMARQQIRDFIKAMGSPEDWVIPRNATMTAPADSKTTTAT